MSSSQLLFTSQYANYGIRWLTGGLLGLTIHLGILWWGLDRNYRRHEQAILPTLGYGNTITLTRGLLISLLAGFLFIPEPQSGLAWIPSLLYLLSSLLDYLDGYVARITNHSTLLGELLDMEFDGLGLLVAIAVGIYYRQLPIWYLVLGFGRQLFIFGIWVRQQFGLPVYEMMPSNNRRIIAGIQMGFISVILWPILAPPATTIACILFSIPLAASFGRDWLVVSGQLRPGTLGYVALHRWARAIIADWGPVLCRLLGAGICGWLLWREWPDMHSWNGLLEQIQVPIVRGFWLSLLYSAPLFLIAFVVGYLGRVSAILLLAVALTELLTVGLQPLTVLFLLALCWVIQFGSGRYALWKPEELFLRSRAGEQ
ncbi:MAG: CDP-alcohol phosphatidyltransferase family protein [Chloroflexota bacterium]